jgi:hypothetical protein
MRRFVSKNYHVSGEISGDLFFSNERISWQVIVQHAQWQWGEHDNFEEQVWDISWQAVFSSKRTVAVYNIV